MLFNDPVFFGLFLPGALLGFFFCARWWGARAALAWLTAASLLFYGYWNPQYLLVLGASIAVNFALGRAIATARHQSDATAFWLTTLGVSSNLALLAYFKYAAFLVETIDLVAGTSWQPPEILLPLAISFFTFQQIAYLVDVRRGRVVEHGFSEYCLFVTFFPQLIAGPIVHHGELLPQIRNARIYTPDIQQLTSGATIFLLGLFKKVVIADGLSSYVSPAYAAAAGGTALSLYEAWSAALGYTLQLYFDFSGYSDMAIGLARMFRVRLPLNFYDPLKASSIIDFWRRWHITLSRFLRDYLYIALGGNRNGRARRYLNLTITMLLGGLWHGAGWTFVIWGGLHGLYLVVNHFWRWVVGPGALVRRLPGFTLAATTLTFLCWTVSMVFFRAESVDSALLILAGMCGKHGAFLPDQLIALLPALSWFGQPAYMVQHLGGGTVLGAFQAVALLAFGMGVVFFGRNLHRMSAARRRLLLALTFAWTLQAVFFGGVPSEFLYFQF